MTPDQRDCFECADAHALEADKVLSDCIDEIGSDGPLDQRIQVAILTALLAIQQELRGHRESPPGLDAQALRRFSNAVEDGATILAQYRQREH